MRTVACGCAVFSKGCKKFRGKSKGGLRLVALMGESCWEGAGGASFDVIAVCFWRMVCGWGLKLWAYFQNDAFDKQYWIFRIFSQVFLRLESSSNFIILFSLNFLET